MSQLRRLEHLCFPKDAWPLWDLIGLLTFPNVIRLKAMHLEEMVGFIAGDVRQPENLSWIATVGVLPEYRGRGIGSQLMLACEQRLPTAAIRLCVRINNEPAIDLYRRLGYQVIGNWKQYYQDGEDAMVMEKKRVPLSG